MAKLTLTDKAGVISLGRFFEAAARVAVMMVLSRELDNKAVYGTYRQLWMIYFLSLPLFRSGLGGAVIYFWPKAGAEGRKELILQNLFLHTAAGLLFFAVLYHAAPLIARAFHNEALAMPLRIFSVFPLLGVPSLTADAVLLSADRPLLVAATSFANRVVPFGICLIGLAALGWPLTRTFLAVVVGAGVLLVITAWITLRFASGSPFRWRWRAVVDQIRFAIPMGTSPLVAVFTRYTGLLVVSLLYGPAVAAVFANGSVELPVFPILASAASAVIMPEMSARSTNGRTDLMMDVWHRAVRKVAFIVLPAAAFLFAYGRQTVLILFSSRYLESLPIFLIMLFVLPFRIANFMVPLMLTKKARAVVAGSIIALVSVIGLSVALVPVLGLAGPAVAAVLSRAIWNGYFVVKIHQLLGVPYRRVLPWQYLVGVSGLAVVSAAASLVAKLLHWAPVPQILAGGVVFSIVFVPISLLTNVFPALERGRLRKLGMAALGFLRRLSSRILHLLGR